MSDVVIRAEKLGKRYRLGERERYLALRDILGRSLRAPFRWLNRRSSPFPNPSSNGFIWALRDATFEVRTGEVVGIIGPNGAGKSTLLKILARITKPTEGYADMRGRIGSLLEVGTGFHPELTGRENVYLSGAILGMKKAEIQKKFDEIVAFAELEKFLDTPVKHYSSGMYVRLAFAVAAHLEPDILLVDEVLAVGDAAFQNKCLSKLRELTEQGITSLFVSHNIHLVEIMARGCFYLDKGKTQYFSDASHAIERYLRTIQDSVALGISKRAQQEPTATTEDSVYEIISVTASSTQAAPELQPGEDLIVTVHYRLPSPTPTVHFNVSLWSEKGLLITSADTRMGKPNGFNLQCQGEIACRFLSPPFISGKYSVRAYIISDLDWPLASFGWGDGRLCWFTLRPKAENLTTGMNWFITQADYGIVKLPHEWAFRE